MRLYHDFEDISFKLYLCLEEVNRSCDPLVLKKYSEITD